MTVISKNWVAVFVLAASTLANAHGLVRRDDPGTGMAVSVAVPAGADLLFVAGVLPDAADPGAPAGSPARMGDMAAQARSALGKIEQELEAAGYAMDDIVKMDVYVVGEPDKGGAVDYMGLTSAYLAYFGKNPAAIPVRTTVQLESLQIPGVLVQLAVTAARVAHSAAD